MEVRGLSGQAKIWQRVVPAGFSLEDSSCVGSPSEGRDGLSWTWDPGHLPRDPGCALQEWFDFAEQVLCASQGILEQDFGKHCGRKHGCRFQQVPLTSSWGQDLKRRSSPST
eukprot:5421019-Pyramimonas_sp.AAC.1